MDTDTFTKTVVTTVLLGGAAYIVYRNRGTIMRLLNMNKRFHNEDSPIGNNDAMKRVGNAFLTYADNFEGIYEALYRAASGSLSKERIFNTFAEWNIRMNNIRKAPVCLKDWWAIIANDKEALTENELRGRMEQVLDMLFLSGIKRDNRQILTVTNETMIYYQSTDGGSWSLGQELQVESPCWYIPCTPVRILEKGYCEII